MGKDRTQTVLWPTSRLMTAQDVARLLGCSDKEIYKMAACGEIPCMRITARMVRFDPDDLDKWLASKKRVGDGW